MVSGSPGRAIAGSIVTRSFGAAANAASAMTARQKDANASPDTARYRQASSAPDTMTRPSPRSTATTAPRVSLPWRTTATGLVRDSLVRSSSLARKKMFGPWISTGFSLRTSSNGGRSNDLRTEAGT